MLKLQSVVSVKFAKCKVGAHWQREEPDRRGGQYTEYTLWLVSHAKELVTILWLSSINPNINQTACTLLSSFTSLHSNSRQLTTPPIQTSPSACMFCTGMTVEEKKKRKKKKQGTPQKNRNEQRLTVLTEAVLLRVPKWLAVILNKKHTNNKKGQTMKRLLGNKLADS